MQDANDKCILHIWNGPNLCNRMNFGFVESYTIKIWIKSARCIFLVFKCNRLSFSTLFLISILEHTTCRCVNKNWIDQCAYEECAVHSLCTHLTVLALDMPNASLFSIDICYYTEKAKCCTTVNSYITYVDREKNRK